jgi:hypothetical protein
MASIAPTSPTKEQPPEPEAGKEETELSTPPSDDLQPKSDQDSGPADTPPADPEPEWVSGFKLFTIMIAITLVCFLMLLDTSIIVTVRVKTIYFLFATK